MLERIKKLLGIGDDLQDDVLNIIIENVSSHLKVMLGKDIPDDLNFIVEEITIRRFNRLGTEGMKSESVEGQDRKSTRLNSSHVAISYAVFCLQKKKKKTQN